MHKISIASDHAGFLLKQEIIAFFEKFLPELKLKDKGTKNQDSVDYPDYAEKVCKDILEGKAEYGILICGSGNGIAMAANRHRGIRAAVCRSGLEAKLARSHNDANVLCLGARISGIEVALDCVRAFLETQFEGARHAKRVEKLG